MRLSVAGRRSWTIAKEQPRSDLRSVTVFRDVALVQDAASSVWDLQGSGNEGRGGGEGRERRVGNVETRNAEKSAGRRHIMASITGT